MSADEFVDYYELLQLSPNADPGTIEHSFRYFAKMYHPDNVDCANTERFRKIVDAHQTLADPETRAGYDVKYQEYWDRKWKLASEASYSSAFSYDKLIRERLLSLLYIQRRRNTTNPGMGNYEMARLLTTPLELLEFHLWYLRTKGWVERLDTGLLAITALGVDQVEENRLLVNPDHLLENYDPARKDEAEREDKDRNLLERSS